MRYLTIKRKLRVIIGRLIQSIATPKTRTSKPQKMTQSEISALTIFSKILQLPETKLYYDIKTGESFLQSEAHQIYLFLESRNIKIINSVYGFDVRLSQELENHMLEKFTNEMSKRRSKFKSETLSKINHSLELTVKKVQQPNP